MAGPDLSNYRLSFSDEFNTFKLFDGQSGWKPHDYYGNRYYANNEELQIYTDPNYKGSGTEPLGLNPFSVENGVLTITAEPFDASTLPPGVTVQNPNAQYTSGMISTAQTFSQEQGYFEMRAQLPEGEGLWPQFWLEPADGNWPPEIDIFEVVGHFPSHIHQTLHLPNKPYQTHIDLDRINTADGFHTYGVLWDEDEISWYVDGQKTWTLPNLVDEPMFIIANLALKDFPNGGPDENDNWPAEMKIDYIRVYEEMPDGGTPTEPPPVTAANPPASGTPEVGRTGTNRNDKLLGTDRNDYFDGRGGDDTMTGLKGDDTYIVNSTNDRIVEQDGQGIDTILLAIDRYTLPNHVENLNITLGTQFQTHVWDNSKNNLLTAGAGNDTFHFTRLNGQDRINGFTVGKDRIDLDDSIVASQVKGYVVSGSLVLDLPGDHSITLAGVTDASVTSSLFV